MTPEALWKRYAAIWSLATEERGPELKHCLAEDATYCDPNQTIEGLHALSDYMGEFQRAVPEGRFEIRSVLHHHNRSLACWTMLGADGQLIQTGTSFGQLTKDGRLRQITGFFDVPGRGNHA